jgi:hypothetical protein
VEKEITMPDNSGHFILLGPDQNKYLIPSGTYSHYNIKTGSVINCKVDKINCKGEIFLEPKNPFYNVNKSYIFEVAGYESRSDSAGIIHDVVIVLDKHGNRIPVLYENNNDLPEIGSGLKLMVERITKGKIFLYRKSDRANTQHLKSGLDYEFEIMVIEKGLDNEEYFIIKDPYGITHSLSRKFYEYYGFAPGKRFRGRIVRYSDGGERIIEPENPYYKPGSVIKLEVVSNLKNLINNSFTVNLKDSFGFMHCIETYTLPENSFVWCRILKIKKGKPLLKLM